MKFAFKSLIAAAAFIAAHAASAATVTITLGSTVYKGHTLSGSETLTLSPDALSVLDVLGISSTSQVSAYGGSTVSASWDPASTFLMDISTQTPLVSTTVDGTTDEMQSIAGKGGLTLLVSARSQPPVSSGGSLTITDLDVDLTTKTVYATLIGANGVGTLTHIALWNLDTTLGPTSLAALSAPDGGGTLNLTAQGLHLTANGYNQIVAALGLRSLGKAALSSISDFGIINVSLTSVLQPLTTCSVNFKTTNKNAQLFSSEVTVNNAGSNAATGWKVNWRYNKPTLLLKVKNAKISNKSLTNYTAAPTAANATIAAGASTTFSFRGHANGGTPTVSGLSATLGDQTCAVTPQ